MDENEEIIFTRTEKLTEKIIEVSELIKNLNITYEQNEILVNALKELLFITEKETFVQGVNLALNIFGINKSIEVEHTN